MAPVLLLVVDSDGDGLRDLFFTTRIGSVAQLHNVDGQGQFVLEPFIDTQMACLVDDLG